MALKNKYYILDLNDVTDPMVMANIFSSFDDAVDAIEEHFGINPLRYQVVTHRQVNKHKLHIVKGYKLKIRKLKYEYPSNLSSPIKRKTWRKSLRRTVDRNNGNIKVSVPGLSKNLFLSDLAKTDPTSKSYCFKVPNVNPNIWYLQLSGLVRELQTESSCGIANCIAVDFDKKTVYKKLVYLQNSWEIIPLKTMVFYSRLNKIIQKVKDKSILIQMNLWEELQPTE